MSLSIADRVRRESLSELRSLGGWFSVNHGLTITLVGGWAVFSYNEYLGSFDIDCLGPRDPFTLQLNIYMNADGYVRESDSPFGAASESWKKPVHDGTTRVDDIYIDACDFDFKNVFSENPKRELPYSLCLEQKYLNRRQIAGEYFYVPIKELLLLYKVKAARDRRYVMTHNSHHSSLGERIRGKITKDYSDLTALLDPRFGGPMDGYVLRELINRYDLLFVTDTISGLPEQPGISEYARTRQTSMAEIRSWIEKIMSDLNV